MHLLDLKQKQANVVEALSASKQAEASKDQLIQANEQTREQVNLAKLVKKDSEVAARQGRTVMLFTVVTIIFVRS